VWHRDTNVFEFCQAHLLYFRLQAKKNNYFDARMRTTIFLRAISTSAYANIVTLLQTQVDSYRNPDDDGYLPHHLRLNGIATLINNNAKARVRDLATPRIHRMDGASSGLDLEADDWDQFDEAEHPYSHVQGYTPRALRLDQGRDDKGSSRDRPRGFYKGRGDPVTPGFPGPRDRRGDKSPSHQGERPPYPRRGDDDRHGDDDRRVHFNPHGRSIRPDRRRRPYLPDVICAACKRRGHPATSCDMLAIALFVDRHKQQLSDSERSSIEETWLARWKDKVGQPTRMPRQVMKAYCEDMNISADHLIEAMDWECWPISDEDGSDDE
jgi:hypothetical protein